MDRYMTNRLKLIARLQSLITVRELIERGILTKAAGYREWDHQEGRAVITALVAEDEDGEEQEGTAAARRPQ